ncbi:hypothetical protein YC2023_060408 [Brassica napus]
MWTVYRRGIIGGIERSLHAELKPDGADSKRIKKVFNDYSWIRRSTRSLTVTRLGRSQSVGADRSLAVARLDLSLSLDSLSCGHSTRSLWLLVMDSSLAVTQQIILLQSLGSISHSHSTRSLAVTRSFCRHSAVTRGHSRSLAVTRLALSQSSHSRSLDSLSRSRVTRGHSTRSLAVTRLALSQSLDRYVVTRWSLAVNRLAVTRLALLQSSHSRSLDSLSCGHSTRSLTFTRSFCRHSTILSSLGGYSWSLESLSHGHSTRSLSVESLAVTQLALSLSLDSLSRSHLIIMSSLYRSVVTRPFCHHSTVLSSLDRSVVTRPFCRHSAQIILSQSLGSISRSHWTRSLAVTQLALCCYSSRLALSQSLGSDRSLAVTRIARNLSIDTSSMATSFGGSEHCPRRSFAQPSRSKKSDQNQKYVDDSSPEMVRL